MENKNIGRRKAVGLSVLGFIAVAGVSTWSIHKFFSENEPEPSYYEAKNNPALQEKWVRNTMEKHGVYALYSDVIIITAENANKHARYYDRKERVRQNNRELATLSEGKYEDFGTHLWSMPKLYVPTEAFTSTEGDLTSIIVYHEANHAKAFRSGFGFINIGDFRFIDNPSKFNGSMINAVLELEGHKEQIEKGTNIMSPHGLQFAYQKYLSFYIQLWRYGPYIKQEATKLLKERYFQPWMKNTKSLWVYEGADRSIKYGGSEEMPFITSEIQGNNKKYYIQFKFRNNPNQFLILKEQLPTGL